MGKESHKYLCASNFSTFAWERGLGREMIPRKIYVGGLKLQQTSMLLS